MNNIRKVQVIAGVVLGLALIISAIIIFQPTEKRTTIHELELKLEHLREDIADGAITAEEAELRMAEYNAELERLKAMP